MIRIAVVIAVIVLAVAAPAGAAPELVKIGDFDRPVHIASPPDDTQLFVVERVGRVKTLDGATFLDITGQVNSTPSAGCSRSRSRPTTPRAGSSTSSTRRPTPPARSGSSSTRGRRATPRRPTPARRG